MFQLRRMLPFLTIASLILAFVTTTPPVQAAPSAQTETGTETPVPPADAPDPDGLLAALDAEIRAHEEEVMGLLVYDILVDNIQYSPDGSLALIWLAMRDPETDEIVATEPFLGIGQWDGSAWTVTIQADQNWLNVLALVPEDMLGEELRSQLQPPAPLDVASQATYTGYKLPWRAGLAKRMVGSIAHVYGYASCPTTCLYAFDFADGTMFELRAAKSGTVKYFKWTCANGDESCTNYLVLEDRTTTPTTYQVYYHLAYDSIPSALRVAGAVVNQGDFIGYADDTGYSTGHHLHFHVHTTANSVWGKSVDITFDDVSINGGRPRACYEVTGSAYIGQDGWLPECQSGDLFVSGNTNDPVPPTGGIISPYDETTLTNPSLRIDGWGYDDLLFGYSQLKINTGSGWQNLGGQITTNTFSTTVNLCELGIPNGPFSLGLYVEDRSGNPADLTAPVITNSVRRLVNNACTYTAPPEPECVPGTNQIALFNSLKYEGGCDIYTGGNPTWGYASTLDGLHTHVAENDAESLLVGSGVRVTLFDESSYGGRSITFESDDINFSDDPFFTGRPSSLALIEYGAPDEPTLSVTGNRSNTSDITTQDSLVLVWSGAKGAVEFSSTLTGPDGYSKSLAWQRGSTWSVGSLPLGTYTWSVTGRNSTGTRTASTTFTVSSLTIALPASVTAPYTFTFESGAENWAAGTSSLWRLAAPPAGSGAQAWVYNRSDTGTYADATQRAGDLTSPPIVIPAGTTLYLRFSYYFNTEYAGFYYPVGTQFDQRRVQISVDNSAYTDLLQLSEDYGNQWLQSPAITLDSATYGGKTIRLRFHFDTVDANYNAYYGWAIDQVSLTTTVPDSCSESSPNPSPSQATALSGSGSVAGAICPGGDLDFYSLDVQAGQTVNFAIDTTGSSLNPVLTIVDRDTRSQLAINFNGSVWQNSIAYTFPEAGEYYIKVKSRTHPVGGTAYTYTLTTSMTSPNAPTLAWITPASSLLPQNSAVTLQVSASDSDGSIQRVEFWMHDTDWATDANSWVKLGTDSSSSGGWTYTITPSSAGLETGSVLYAVAVDDGGHATWTARWDLELYASQASTALQSLPATSSTTLIPLQWTVTGNSNTVQHFEIQIRDNGGSWTNWNTTIPASARQVWFYGVMGHTYDFRVRGIDPYGYAEPYPTSPEATTLIQTCTVDAYDTADNSAGGAAPLALDTPSTSHNLCGLNDVDWSYFNGVAGTTYFVEAASTGGNAAVLIQVWDPGGATVATQIAAPGPGEDAAIAFTASATGRHYIRIYPFDYAYPAYSSLLAGTGATYDLRVTEGSRIFLPMVGQ